MKGAYIVVALGGVGTVGGASALYFYKGGGSVETLRSKFSQSLIGDGETSIWDAKWSKLKVGTVSGSNENLKLAFSKKDGGKDQEGKEDLKKGCKELYNSSFMGREDKNFLDFTKYCVKNNKEKAGGTWISGGNEDGSWGTKLENLKSHAGDIDRDLEAIKNKSVPTTPPDNQDTERKTAIKEWCNTVGDEWFESESVRYRNSLAYCRTT